MLSAVARPLIPLAAFSVAIGMTYDVLAAEKIPPRTPRQRRLKPGQGCELCLGPSKFVLRHEGRHVALVDPQSGSGLALDPGETRLGRNHPEAKRVLKLPAGVSREHARLMISRSGDAFKVEVTDLGSTQGTSLGEPFGGVAKTLDRPARPGADERDARHRARLHSVVGLPAVAWASLALSGRLDRGRMSTRRRSAFGGPGTTPDPA